LKTTYRKLVQNKLIRTENEKMATKKNYKNEHLEKNEHTRLTASVYASSVPIKWSAVKKANRNLPSQDYLVQMKLNCILPFTTDKR